MKKIQEKIESIERQLVLNEKFENQKIFLNEMVKIGIEKLPYSYTSLKKFIDAETMDVHYNKHYKGYVKKLNDALSKKDYGDVELEQIIKTISRFNKTVRNNAGGAFNHALFWKMLSPKKQTPSKEFMSVLEKNFDSFKEFKTKFEEVSKNRFGSGWCWLVLTKNNTLKIISTPNQDNPLMNVVENGGYPLLGLDLWEHAYYLKYKNKRDDYISNFWNCVNWEFVEKLYKMKVKTKIKENKFSKVVLSESASESCSRESINAYKFIFNTNPNVKKIFRFAIEKNLADVFKDNYYETGEYGKDEMSGVYDIEKPGRSVLNKINTNYECFCILLQDMNKVLKSQNKPEIKMIGLTPFEQISEVRKFVNLINEYKYRIFSNTSPTFQNLMSILNKRDTMGEQIEDKSIEILKKKFGKENVIKVGGLGSKQDMVKGVDCVVRIDGQMKSVQIKPYQSLIEKDDNYTLLETGQVKKYTTDFMVFFKTNNKLLVFANDKTKIVDGNYVFPKNSLIYELN